MKRSGDAAVCRFSACRYRRSAFCIRLCHGAGWSRAEWRRAQRSEHAVVSTAEPEAVVRAGGAP